MKNAKVNPANWKGKNVFVTGHTGFKGGWLSLWLHTMEAKVTGYAHDPETTPNFHGLVGLGPKLANDVRGDINDFELLKSSMNTAKPEIVIHMAAQPLVRKSYREPVKTYMDNVMGTISVLEAVRQTPSVRAVVVITTDKCYENKEWHWAYREDEPMGGYDPYSSSKACAEIATAAWRRSFFKDDVLVATVRAGNVVGGGDWSEDRLIPDAVRAARAKTPLIIRNPNATRPWQHVLDPVHGYLLLGERLLEGRKDLATAFNFGPRDEDARPVHEVLNLLQKNWAGGFEWTVETSDKNPHEANLLKLDSSRAKALLGWSPRWQLEDTLAKTAEWYRTAPESDRKLYDLSVRQLNDFFTESSTER